MIPGAEEKEKGAGGVKAEEQPEPAPEEARRKSLRRRRSLPRSPAEPGQEASFEEYQDITLRTN